MRGRKVREKGLGSRMVVVKKRRGGQGEVYTLFWKYLCLRSMYRGLSDSPHIHKITSDVLCCA